MEIDLAFIWAGLIAFAILAYVVLDGFDLGVGILFPLLDSDADRDQAMNSVAPVWDGNETWLVLGGGGLYAVFPLAYATVLPALYAPLTAMLIGLIFRGVSFEFRWKTERGRFLWDWGFAGGSLLAAFMQGITLGALVQGIEIADRAYAGGWWDWLTPFSLLTGVALVIGYMLLGATWLVMKTEGGLKSQAQDFASRSGVSTLALIGLVSLITPMLNPDYVERWFGSGTIAFSVVVPTLVMVAELVLFRGLKTDSDAAPSMRSVRRPAAAAAASAARRNDAKREKTRARSTRGRRSTARSAPTLVDRAGAASGRRRFPRASPPPPPSSSSSSSASTSSSPATSSASKRQARQSFCR